jgi:hypothetical protein
MVFEKEGYRLKTHVNKDGIGGRLLRNSGKRYYLNCYLPIPQKWYVVKKPGKAPFIAYLSMIYNGCQIFFNKQAKPLARHRT